MGVRRVEVNEDAEFIRMDITSVGAGSNDPDMQVCDTVVLIAELAVPGFPQLSASFDDPSELDNVIEALTRARETVWGPK
jgi:hypothetical protein